MFEEDRKEEVDDNFLFVTPEDHNREDRGRELDDLDLLERKLRVNFN